MISLYIALSIFFQLLSAVFMKLSTMQGNFFVFYFLMIICLVIQAILWQKIIKVLPLYYAYSWNSLLFVLIPLVSYVFFNEKITFKNFVGVIFIILGTVLLSKKDFKKCT